jgi:hypothetical protein
MKAGANEALFELSRRKLDLEHEELILQRLGLEIQEKEIAMKREGLGLTLLKQVAEVTRLLDRDVRSRVSLR